MQKPEHIAPLVSIRLPAVIENLPGFIGPILALASTYHLAEEKKGHLELALEEALVNIFSYAYPEKTGYVDLTCRIIEDHLVILIEDQGLPFSVDSVATPDITADIMERTTGGLGIHLIRNLMDDVSYRREGDRNLLELTLAIHQMNTLGMSK